MGGKPSALVEEEQSTWTQPHSLQIDSLLRAEQVPLLADFTKEVHLCWIPYDLDGSRSARHYFITNASKKQMISFGDGYKVCACVEIKPCTHPKDKIMTEKCIKVTDAVTGRMEEVCGARGHSFCLRNSEHLAKYIATGSWVSTQMFPQGFIMEIFKSAMKTPMPEINTPPEEMKKKHLVKKLYPQPVEYVKYKATKTVLSADEANNGSYNVVLLGPTGSGKSSLINLLYNRTVCPAAASPTSVTRHMRITQGTANIMGKETLCNIIDSIGFCDSELSPTEVMATIKQHLKLTFLEVDRVVMVCSGRLEAMQQSAMKQIMEWLKYSKNQNYGNFAIIYNKADNLSEAEREEYLAQICTLLGAKSSHVTTKALLPSSRLKGLTANPTNVMPLQIAVGFPPAAEYPAIMDDHHLLLDVIFHPFAQRLTIEPNDTACMIL
mmetsp:Transcript_86848/g.202148  ORF Transcript_86848/g.202148 Transcript_86848/m.202148 type:complete len:437 (+) Transcript_86848:37-1347(+)|eukprot:CAMPEP_0171097846 /NCGR_PEP_ID=MMETSP0766_2-20121228/47778_1 /TAXON_ID=439317 /ORGANISM="Gambierdiscus australes, Strain CAWD 149" /LENGTH=436 /DNA_ID=CAMNT_0011557101 /DNA_START=37 /DNA_END=1347 /DNA_ORIENTATION=-